ncbi:unnamed protein product [Protopolystoma xenopodis]|uniref:Uncharacterized protein n=1 Tax=Protopolystoma xenopodis TaxID=117903 RepID=A0A3S5AWQ7_9PLAT|nr:unnamed protein product [Protopolystoma xenopodis]
MFDNVPNPLSDAGNHDDYYGRRLRTSLPSGTFEEAYQQTSKLTPPRTEGYTPFLYPRITQSTSKFLTVSSKHARNPYTVPEMLIQNCGLIRNSLPSGPIRVPSCSVGFFPNLPVSVISLHRSNVSMILKAWLYTLPQAFDSTYTPPSLSNPLKSGFSIGMAT